MAKNTKTIKVGDLRFYAPHGVVRLVAVEEREFGGSRGQFYVLELVRGGTVLLPCKAMPDSTLRLLIAPDKAKELLKKMKSKAKPKGVAATNGKAGARACGEELRSGDADKYTEILHGLMHRKATDKITSSDQKSLELARAYFVDEVGAVLKTPADKLQAEIDELFAEVAAKDKVK